MFYFMRHNRREIQSDALHAIGFVCVRHHKFMLESKLKRLYIDILTQEFYPEQHKIKVLNNIECFLIEEEAEMIRNDKKCEFFLRNMQLVNDTFEIPTFVFSSFVIFFWTHDLLFLLQGKTIRRKRISKKWETCPLAWPQL